MNAELDRWVEQVLLQPPYPPAPGGLSLGHGFDIYHDCAGLTDAEAKMALAPEHGGSDKSVPGGG